MCNNTDYDHECSVILARLTKPLFKPVSNKYAITVNIQPTKRMNKRHWRLYSHAQQKAMLGRIEARFRLLNPSVKLRALNYEVCPVLNQIHYHALYEMPFNYKWEMETYYKRICDATDGQTTIPWRYLDIRPIDSEAGWLQYIQKSQ